MPRQRKDPPGNRTPGEQPAGPVDRTPTRVDLELLGARIRHTRTEHRLTLMEVASRTGLSVSMISALERGVTNASIGTLIAVANALGVSLVELFGMDDRQGPSPVIRADDQPIVQSVNGFRRRLVYRDQGRGIEMAHNQYDPGALSAHRPLRHGGFEFGLLLEGELEVELNGQVHHLRQGDAMAYPSNTPHRISNPGKKTSQTIWVNLYQRE